MAVTTSSATRTAGPEEDHAAGLVAPLHWSDVDIVQRGHYSQQRVLAAWFTQRGS
jgi:hypothetical protein